MFLNLKKPLLIITCVLIYYLGYHIGSSRSLESEIMFMNMEFPVDYEIAIQDSSVYIKPSNGYVMYCNIDRLEDTIMHVYYHGQIVQ